MNSNLVDRIMALINAGPQTPEDLADKTLALTECIARILVLRLGDSPVTVRAVADALTQRLIARISEGSVANNEFMN